MKKYNVNVNGKTYQIEIEEVQNFDPKQAPAAPAAAAPAKEQPAAPATVPVAAPAGGETISCPMPGTILDVRCSEGASVKKGDILFILEAMKMETSIVANQDGVIDKIYVKEGEQVNQGDLLVSFVQEG